MSQAIEITIKNRIYGHGMGWCFTPDHFLDLKNTEAVKKALQRLTQAGVIRRLARGLYEYPEQHKTLGTIPASADKVAQAISEKDHVRIQPSGAYVANLVGFSEQVPARVVFDTEGVSKKLTIGKLQITFRRTTPRNMAMAGTRMGLLIQALRHIGSQHITPKTKRLLKKHLAQTNPKEIDKGLKYAPTWIRDLINKVLRERV